MIEFAQEETPIDFFLFSPLQTALPSGATFLEKFWRSNSSLFEVILQIFFLNGFVFTGVISTNVKYGLLISNNCNAIGDTKHSVVWICN